MLSSYWRTIMYCRLIMYRWIRKVQIRLSGYVDLTEPFCACCIRNSLLRCASVTFVYIKLFLQNKTFHLIECDPITLTRYIMYNVILADCRVRYDWRPVETKPLTGGLNNVCVRTVCDTHKIKWHTHKYTENLVFNMLASREHVYIMLTPLNPSFIHYFSYFCSIT